MNVVAPIMIPFYFDILFADCQAGNQHLQYVHACKKQRLKT